MFKRTQLNRSRAVASNSSLKTEPQSNNFLKGEYTYTPNDIRPADSLTLIQDARVASIGQYKTRKGCDPYSVPIGEAVNVEVTSTTGAADKSFSSTVWYAERVQATATGRLSKVEIRIKNDASATGTPMVAVYSDDSGEVGVQLGRSSIASSLITSSYQYLGARYIEAPTITNASYYWVVVYTQGGTGSYKISSTTSLTNADTSTSAGGTWSDTSYSLNVKLYTATSGGVKGLRRVYKSDGTAYTFFAHGTTLYSVNDTTGATTAIDTGLDSDSTDVRMEFINDILYYTDGEQKPRKYDFAVASEVSAAPSTARNVLEHVNHAFYFDSTDRTKVYWSDLGDFEVFPSTNFRYVPASRKSDKLAAMAKLNGLLYFFTLKNKFVHYGQDNATFQVDEAPAQKGTFSQESVAYDENYIYFISDDGVYKFNGTSEENIALPILDKIEGLLDKDNCRLELHNNRLYVWYTPNAEADNSSCLVYNTVLNIWESEDTGTFIGRTFARHDNSNQFLQASNRIGAVYYGELSTNDYNNLGDILQTELKTHYDPMGAPQQLKSIRKWRPDFRAQSGNYSAQVGVAADFSDDVTFYDVPMQSSGFQYDAADALYDTATYASEGEIHITTLEVPGEAYRWQRIYKHHAAREPIEFTGETLAVQMQRMR